MILESFEVNLFCARNLILYQFFVKKVKRTILSDYMLDFNDKENIVTNVDFDCYVTFHPDVSTKVKLINPERT